MARNVEIKARAVDLSALAERAAAIADTGPVEIAQDDTFFRCAAGRLKLRAFPDGAGELIFYRRADASGPRECEYRIASVDAAGPLRIALGEALGVVGRVRKRRTLFLAGRTRIHLDRVEELGAFLELEVVLDEGEDAEHGMREAREMMERLGVRADQLVAGAYADMLAATGCCSFSEGE